MQTCGMDDSTSRSSGDSEPEPPTKGRFPLPEFTARVHGPRTRVVETDLKCQKGDQQLYDFINDDGDDIQTTDGAAAAAGMSLEERYDVQLRNGAR